MILSLNFCPMVYRFTPELAISLYGICLAIGIGLFNYFVEQKLKINLPKITDQQLSKIYMLVFLGSLLGARFLWVINEICQGSSVDLYEFLALWQGGFSILGALLGSIIFLIPYLKYNKIEVKKFLAIVLIYLPLAQAIGRLGCLLVGCCHGANYEGLFSIVYTNNESLAPNFISLHPTQLYSSLFYGLLFLVLLLIQTRKNDDLIIRTYFLSAALERFIIDFMRGDRQIVKNLFGGFFSSHQLIAMLIISFMIILIMCDIIQQKKIFNRARSR